MKKSMPIVFLFALAAGIALIWYTNRLDRQTSVRLAAHAAPDDTTAQAEAHALAVRYLDEVATHKHATAAQHHHFADASAAHPAPATECLFRALAHADRIHEFRCAEAIGHLGANYRPPRRVQVVHLSTPHEALRHTLHRMHEDSSRYCRAIAIALQGGNHYAARLLAQTAGCDLQQLELLRRHLEQADTTAGYQLCPTCGLLFGDDAGLCFCPTCLTPSWRFVLYAPTASGSPAPAAAHSTTSAPVAAHSAASAPASPRPTATTPSPHSHSPMR